jgi:hypothetical protein
MNPFARTAIALATIALLISGVAASASSQHQSDITNKKELVKPTKGTALGAILAGIKLVKAGDFGTWIDKFCHPDDLCYTEKAKTALKRYDLPYLKRVSPHCLKGNEDSLQVTRKQKLNNGELKIFIECNPKGSPRPFRVKQKDGRWYWTKV